jgi:hypothetical protein
VSERKLLVSLYCRGFVVRGRVNLWRRWRIGLENLQEMAVWGSKIG